MESDVHISVIVPVRDDLTVLTRSIPRIMGAVETYSGSSELIIVDNGSEDGSYEWLLRNYADSASILQLANVTVGAVRNYGASRAEGTIFCFVDADCLVEPDHLERAAQALREASAAATGARYQLPDDPSWVESTWHLLHRRNRKEYVKFLSAGNFVIRAEVFGEVGGFNEELETGEDAELCHRLLDEGHRIFHDPAIRVVHLGNPKTLRGFFRKQRWYALGMFGTVTLSSIDKPAVGTLFHALLVFLGLGTFLIGSVDWPVKGGAMVLAVVLIPLTAVVYRWREIGRIVRPFRAILLYEVFFAARLTATVLLLFGSESGWRPRRERSGSMVPDPSKRR